MFKNKKGPYVGKYIPKSANIKETNVIKKHILKCSRQAERGTVSQSGGQELFKIMVVGSGCGCC